jgi:hypothetical protein
MRAMTITEAEKNDALGWTIIAVAVLVAVGIIGALIVAWEPERPKARRLATTPRAIYGVHS